MESSSLDFKRKGAVLVLLVLPRLDFKGKDLYFDKELVLGHPQESTTKHWIFQIGNLTLVFLISLTVEVNLRKVATSKHLRVQFAPYTYAISLYLCK